MEKLNTVKCLNKKHGYCKCWTISY